MTQATTILSLLKGLGTDNSRDYLKTSLAASLDILDALFHTTTGHTHTGAGTNGPKIPVGSLANGAATGAALGADVATLTGAQTLTNKTLDIVRLTGLTGATAATRYVGGTASGAPVAGTFAVGDFVIDQTGKIWVCTVAGTPGTWVAAGAATGNQQGVNNGLELWQRGTGAFTASAAYTADRWQIILAGTDTLSVSKDTTAANRKANSGAAATCTFVLGTGAGASRFKQRLVVSDGYQHLLGQAFSVRCPVKASAANAVRAFVTSDGTGGTTTFSGYHTGGGAFENLDVANVTIPTDATYVEYGLAFATTVTASLDNVMPTQNSTAQDYVGLVPSENLARCQRYYEVHGGVANTMPTLTAYTAGANVVGVGVPLATEKAVAPTVTKLGTWTVINCIQPSVQGASVHGYRILTTASAAGVVEFMPDTTDDLVTIEANP